MHRSKRSGLAAAISSPLSTSFLIAALIPALALLGACGSELNSSPGVDGGSGRDASKPPPPPPGSFLPAFPGAEGFGTETPGGRGGRVFVVTTLDWDGPGSFSEAMLAEEPRFVTFAVSGVIKWAPLSVSLKPTLT